MNPFKNINRIGMNAVMKCLRMAGNSLSYRTAFSLDLVGGPLFPDLAMILKATLIRASLNTVTGFTSMHQQLQSMATELLPLGVHRYKFALPIGWDSPAFCSNLFEAHGVSRNLNVSAMHRSGSCAGKPRSSASLQAQVFKELFAAQAHPSKFWCNLLSDRLLTLCPGECFSRDSVSHECFLQLAKVLMSIKPGPRLMVIKTLVNSWSTSRRMHEPTILRCIFCGEGQDYLTHYLECDCLWIILTNVANLNCSYLSLSASERLGLMHPSKVRFKLLAGAFLVYHAIKLSHLDVVHLAHSSGEFSDVHELMLRLATIHLKEVGLIEWSAACSPTAASS